MVEGDNTHCNILHINEAYFERFIYLYFERFIYIEGRNKFRNYVHDSGPGSVVGIATAYGLDGPGIESRWREIFRTSPDRPWDPPSLLYNGYRVFLGDKVLPGRDADPSPSSSAEV